MTRCRPSRYRYECARHGFVKAYVYWSKDARRGKDYRYRVVRCSLCVRDNYQSWAEKNRQKVLKKSRDWYYENKEKALARQAATKDRRNMLARERRALRRLGAV